MPARLPEPQRDRYSTGAKAIVVEMTWLGVLVILSAGLWLAILLLPWQPWRNTELLRLPGV
jgi:hypothetical protein